MTYFITKLFHKTYILSIKLIHKNIVCKLKWCGPVGKSFPIISPFRARWKDKSLDLPIGAAEWQRGSQVKASRWGEFSIFLRASGQENTAGFVDRISHSRFFRTILIVCLLLTGVSTGGNKWKIVRATLERCSWRWIVRHNDFKCGGMKTKGFWTKYIYVTLLLNQIRTNTQQNLKYTNNIKIIYFNKFLKII